MLYGPFSSALPTSSIGHYPSGDQTAVKVGTMYSGAEC